MRLRYTLIGGVIALLMTLAVMDLVHSLVRAYYREPVTGMWIR